jgi:AcrR family transcriptional regulator
MAPKLGRRPRSEEQIKTTRAKIVSAALKLFQEEGYSSISIRRLAKNVGCAPMTIYAHFDGKISILQHLWADVLEDVFAHIRQSIKTGKTPLDRLRIAAQIFVSYWLDNPDHFRMVFMSSDIARPDVTTFIQNEETLAHFRLLTRLIEDVVTEGSDTKSKTDTLIASMIGIVFCANTIKDYPWTEAKKMTDLIIASVVKP